MLLARLVFWVPRQVPTTVFTPLELAVVGLTEERAALLYGDSSVQVSVWTGDSLSAFKTLL